MDSNCSHKGWKMGSWCGEFTRRIVYNWRGDGTQTLSSVEKYNPVEDRWVEVANMNETRTKLAVCELGGKLYAVGGDKASFEVYGVEQKKWSMVAFMTRQV